MEIRKLWLVGLVLLSQISLAQIKGKLRTLNCEHSNNSYECYYNELGALFKEKLDKETIDVLLESKENPDTLKLGISFVVTKKGKAFQDFFSTNYNKTEGINDKIRTILNDHVSFVMPLNECYKPVITSAKGILLKYTLLEDEQGQKILQLIPPNREIKQSEKKLFDSIQAPIGRRCKKFIGDNKDLKKCLSRDVQKYIARSFDKDIIKKLKARGLKCSNRSYVSFYYNQEGKPEEVKAISAYPLLEKEVIRIVKGLPKVKPGMKNGKPVRVRFMLPIVLQL